MAIHRPLSADRVQTQKSASTAGEPATETILANPFVSPGPLPVRHPLTGLCAYALAFSTLLSSQGADAHRHKAFAWIEGNPLSLPARLSAVKRLRLTLMTSQPRVLPAYPAAGRPLDGQRTTGLPGRPRHRAPAGFPLVLGAGRNIRHPSQPRQIGH